LCLQLLPERAIVLDDSLLLDGHTAGGIQMGVGVALLRLAATMPVESKPQNFR
jgi:hypothetical protein